MSRRRRLIERNESGYAGTGRTPYADPVNAYSYQTPPQGVSNPQGTPHRGVYAGGPGGAFNRTTNATSYGGMYGSPSTGTYDATNANGAYNATTNANGPIDEAGGNFSRYNATTMSRLSPYRSGDGRR